MSSQQHRNLTLMAVTAGGVVQYPLPSNGRVTIGRADGCEVRVDDASVSRQHAALHVGDELVLEDLGARNGTYVQGAGMNPEPGQTENLRSLQRESLAVRVGDRILVGSVQLVLRRSEASGNDEPGDRQPIVADPQMVELHAQLELAARSPINVLLLGETGVGKEVLARKVHERSPRRQGPFVAISCAAVTESVLEAELFGAEKGSYTGATHTRAGLFETAEGGTLFLDEIGEVSPSTQVKLLRVLEERKVLGVGSRVPKAVDVRFVSATNRDIEARAASGAFRPDLYFRLAGVTLDVPPLRERPSEIEPLGRAFLARACCDLERSTLALTPEALAALQRHSWPGNVRELKNVMERAAALCTGSRVELQHLPRSLQSDGSTAESADVGGRASDGASAAPETLRVELRGLERARILKALEDCAGNQTRAAEKLGMPRRTLTNRLRELDLPRPRK